MQHSSKPVSSNQTGCHRNLEKVVKRHLSQTFNKPITAHNQQAFEQAYEVANKDSENLIFDSFCGTGMSTAILAERHPNAFIIGIDKSANRLDKHIELPDRSNNYLLVRADVDDFWRLAVSVGWKLTHHYLFYPNPWPKSAHLQRRCHGSPLFPTLLALGGKLELRSNWPIYLEEFSTALSLAGKSSQISPLSPEEPITLFETKYQLSGHSLHRCCCNLSQ